MHDERAKEPKFQSERAPWIEPAIIRLSAGSAELLAAVVNDGPGDKS
jgi:hypothetical protein